MPRFEWGPSSSPAPSFVSASDQEDHDDSFSIPLTPLWQSLVAHPFLVLPQSSETFPLHQHCQAEITGPKARLEEQQEDPMCDDDGNNGDDNNHEEGGAGNGAGGGVNDERKDDEEVKVEVVHVPVTEGQEWDSLTSVSSPTCTWGSGEDAQAFNAPIHPSICRRLLSRLVVILAQSAQIFYLYWRWLTFCNSDDTTLFLSLPLIIAETLIVVCGSFITYVLLWNQIERPKLRLNDLSISKKDLPTVDVLIPCYNEPVQVSDCAFDVPCGGPAIWLTNICSNTCHTLQIVTRSVLAALNMDYPSEKLTVCVCDDGNSPGRCIYIPGYSDSK